MLEVAEDRHPSALSADGYRMSRQLIPLRYLFALLLFASPAVGGGVRDTEDFAEITAAVQIAAEEHGPENVLLVCDIDNTLLRMRGDLGGDAWFEWQEYLLENQPKSKMLVAKKFDGLLAAQGLLFTLGRMTPTDETLPERIAAMQQAGIKTLVMTSRSDDFRVATERELNAAGYDFASTALRTEGVPGDVFPPYDLANIGASGLTMEDVSDFNLVDPRGVSYSNGIFMTAGQHKGAMLLTLLSKSPVQYKAVVFVDDHSRHVMRVYDALSRRGIDATAIHFRQQEANVKRFNYSDKSAVTKKWRKLDRVLSEVFE